MIDNTVIVATDLGPSAGSVLDEAHRFALQCGADLLVVHVFQPIGLVTPLFPQRQVHYALAQSEARADAEDILERLVVELGSPLVSSRVLDGIPGDRLLELVRAASPLAVVMGGGPGKLGPVSTLMIRHATCPTLIVRASATGMPNGPVIAATDLAEPEMPAIRAGAVQADLRGVRLEVDYVLEGWPPWIPSSHSTYPVRGPRGQLVDATRKLGDKLRGLGITGTAHAAIGDPAARVVERAHNLQAQLVVVGSLGRSGMRRFFLRSVAETIASTAPCSVLVIPEEPVTFDRVVLTATASHR